jgi:hypothetical protein
MTSLVNSYFNQNQWAIEQTLFNQLKTESIQILGRTYMYLPRNMMFRNLTLGEDVISSFTLAIPIEMYMSNATGFEGDKEMFSKFGLQVQNSYTLIVSNDRWTEEVSSQFDNSGTNGEAPFDIPNYSRPREGDLVYDPLTRFLMEIKFVDHDAEFFQAGKNYLFHLSCESFVYDSEEIDTGILDIDLFENKTQDELAHQLLTESGDMLVWESGGTIMRDITVDNPSQYGTDFVTPTQNTIVIINPFE